MTLDNIENDELTVIKTDCVEFLNIENEIPTQNTPTKYFLHNEILPIIKQIENIIKSRVENVFIEKSFHHISLNFSTVNITNNRFTVSVDDELTVINFEFHSEYLFSDFITYSWAEFVVSETSIWYEFARYLSKRNDHILNITYEDNALMTNNDMSEN